MKEFSNKELLVLMTALIKREDTTLEEAEGIGDLVKRVTKSFDVVMKGSSKHNCKHCQKVMIILGGKQKYDEALTTVLEHFARDASPEGPVN